MKNCSFTGHRQIPEAHSRALTDLVARAIAYAYENGCRNFYTGGALGFDTLCAREIIRFRLTHRDARLVLVIPCKNQADRWSERQVSAYEYTLAEANEIIYTSEEYSADCMKKRNAFLAENCDIMIAYLGKARSGASQTVNMAKRLGKQVFNLYQAAENAN